MLTNDLKYILKPRAINEMQIDRNIMSSHDIHPNIIADIGANIGYYTEALLATFETAEIHAYEPHPDNLEYLKQIDNTRLQIHPYGLFNEDSAVEIGMRDARNNNGTFSIFNKHDTKLVAFKNADNEITKPDFIKIDVEGSELFILQCSSFCENIKAIFIELIYTDEFKMNSRVKKQLEQMNFKFIKQVTKNDQLWLKL